MSADVQVSYQDSDAKWQTYNMKSDAPNLVVFKTQGCPECESMAKEWESLAETCRVKGINVNIDAIEREGNLKLLKKQGIYQYPTIRFFQLGQQHVDFQVQDNGSNLNEKSFLEFLQQNGVNVNPQGASKESISKLVGEVEN